MSTKSPNSQERTAVSNTTTDPRPSRLYLGRDADGCEHHFFPQANAVVVIEAGQRIHRRDLGTGTVESWVIQVGTAYGWADQRLYESLEDALVAQVEG